MIELALPAGSLESALTAFNHGADAVYFGLKEFSARKGAVNFSFEDLSKIRRYSLENGKKTYITLNTLIDDESIDRVCKMLDEISFYGTDGMIIQDLGVASIIRKYYPNLPLHGSTQLAVHTSDGVKVLQDLGFERVVLSRELTIKEIEKIRKECPDVELKVFIHGALCYGFSGLCSASALKCNRSANGGECAQICRSWFSDKQSGKKGYFFSMQDMAAGERLIELNNMGIDSAKVEGRLKSPEYVAAVTEYYRSILDKGYYTKEEENSVKTTFQRKSSDAYLSYKPDRESLVSVNYPGHLGLYVGKVISEKGKQRVIEAEENIENHDGLQYLKSDQNGLLVAEKFSASIVKKDSAFTTLYIDTDMRLQGYSIYKISDSTKREKTPNTNLPLYRKPIDIRVVLDKTAITATYNNTILKKDIALEEAKNKKDIKAIFEKAFSESGTSKYTLKRIEVINNSGLDYPFIVPSFLKEFRRNFYELLDSEKIASVKIEEPQIIKEGFTLPNRYLLDSDLPWSIEVKKLDGRAYITLPPITFDEKALWAKVVDKIAPYEHVTIGLNNISQVSFAKAHPEYDYFADIYLYLPNRFALELLNNEIPNLIGGYLWFERNNYSHTWPFKPTITNYEPPYFISRTCYRHDALGLPCKGCKRHEDFKISQAPDTFTVKVRDCITVVRRDRN